MLILDVNGLTDTKEGVPSPSGVLKKCRCGQQMTEAWYISISGHKYCSEACFVYYTGR